MTAASSPDTSNDTGNVIQIAVPVPLRKHFDYRWETPLPAGTRVLVPFGGRKLVGVVLSSLPASETRPLKAIARVLDHEAAVDSSVFALLQWAASYYHHSIGEVMAAGLPVSLRQPGVFAPPKGELHYRRLATAEQAEAQLARAPSQQQLFTALESDRWLSWPSIQQKTAAGRATLKPLIEKKLIEEQELLLPAEATPVEAPKQLTDEQQIAAEAIGDALGGFRSILLQGVTGSGKTEVYFKAARQCIEAGKQVLFLVPEIALTPQLVSRVRQQLGNRVCVMHSGMSDRARYQGWWMAREGLADAVLGTRSAIFTPLKNPGLIVVDEEHDQSYKQQDGFRYHARDLALKRGSIEQIPVVLGSATPSLESLHNARGGKHQLLRLNNRVGDARLPVIHRVDLSRHVAVNGLSAPIIDAIEQRLERGEQSIVYINRRGYAPVVHCYQCQWQARCDQCDARLTYHRNHGQFRCHHCGHKRPSDANCPQCDTTLFLAGSGTQRIEQALLGRFPHARLCRLDRDEAGTAKKLYRKLEDIRLGHVDIIIGTQLITKGHDFAGISLVCVVNADQGLYSVDFRAPEIMFQQLLQVAGRAGRASADGEVLIQTAHPGHPCLQMIAEHNYDAFAEYSLQQREQANYPPYGYFALFRAESANPDSAAGFLGRTADKGRGLLKQLPHLVVDILHPTPSPMEKLSGRFRFQLLVRCSRRSALHQLLLQWLPLAEQDRNQRNVRWSLDIDPMDML